MSPRKKSSRSGRQTAAPAEQAKRASARKSPGPPARSKRDAGKHQPGKAVEPAAAPSAPKADLRILAGLLLLALIPRLIYLAELQNSPLEDFLSLDTETHHMLAERIARDGTTGEAVFFRAPLYPYMLGLLYKLFDAGRFAPRLIQALVGALAAPLTYLLGLRLAGRGAALAAAIAVSLYWTLVYFGGELLITVLLVPIDLVLILLLTRRGTTDEPPGAGASLAAGAVLGLSALARPNILIFLPAVLFWLAVTVIRGQGGRGGKSGPGRLLSAAFLKPALLVVLGTALLVAPVTVRNAIKGGDPVLIASQGGINFFLGNNPQSNGRSAAAPMAWPEIPQEVKDRHRGNVWVKEIIWISARHIAERELGRTDLKPSEVSGFWFGEAFDFIAGRPGDALGLLARKAYYLLNAYEIPSNKDMEYFIREGKLRTLQLLSLGMPGFFPFGLVGPLALLGIALTLRDWRRHLLVHLFLGTYFLGIILFFVNARYRVPLLPVLLIYAAAAVFELTRIWKDRTPGRGRRLLLPLALLAVFLAVSNSRLFDVRDDILLGTLHYNLANHYVDSGDLERAEKAYAEALRLNPLFPGAHYNLANIFFDRKDYEKAEEHYLKAIEQSGGMADAQINLGIISFARGRDEEAVARLREGLRLAPGSAEGYYNLGNALSRLDRQQEAAEAFELSLRNDPGLWQAAFNLGNSRYALGDLENAAAAYRRTLVSKPDHAPARCNLGIALLQLGRKDEAVTALEKAVRDDPDLSRAHYWLAQLYHERGEREKAIRQLRETVRTEPRNRKAAALLAELQKDGP